MSNYGGMTVNERLYEAGLMKSFDKAVRRRNRAEIVEVLLQVELSPEQAAETTDAILSDPTRYGY